MRKDMYKMEIVGSLDYIVVFLEEVLRMLVVQND